MLLMIIYVLKTLSWIKMNSSIIALYMYETDGWMDGQTDGWTDGQT